MKENLNEYELRTLVRDIQDIARDIEEYNVIRPSTIKTCEVLLSNMKYYCTEEWQEFMKEQEELEKFKKVI